MKKGCRKLSSSLPDTIFIRDVNVARWLRQLAKDVESIRQNLKFIFYFIIGATGLGVIFVLVEVLR